MTAYEANPVKRELVLNWEPHRAQYDFTSDTGPMCGFIGGLGAGKTLSGWVKILQMRPEDGLGLVVAPTFRQLRDGVLQTGLTFFDPFIADVNKSEMMVTMKNGARFLMRSSTRPDDFRSLNIGWSYLDEACYIPEYALKVVLSRIRTGAERTWYTSSPVRNSAAHRILVQGNMGPVFHAPSHANPYLSRAYIKMMRATMSPREAKREIDAEWVEAGGVLWEQDWINNSRVNVPPALVRVVIGVDPATTAKQRSDRTGIIVVGLADTGHAYVLADYSGQYSPAQWAEVVCDLAQQYNADVVCEVNQGGDLVERSLRAYKSGIRYRAVTASKSKAERAQPVSLLYAQSMVHHVGMHTELERQQTSWEPGDKESPDRIDALVWAITHLKVRPRTIVTPTIDEERAYDYRDSREDRSSRLKRVT